MTTLTREQVQRGKGKLLEIAGGAPVAQCVSDIVEAEGFRFPSKRRAYVRGPGLKPVRDLLLISLDIKDFELSV